MTYENVICVPRASLGVMAHQFALAGPAKISANKGKERNKHRGVEIIYTIHYPHKSRYTSNRRYAIRNRKITKEKKKKAGETQGKTYRASSSSSFHPKAWSGGACQGDGP